VRLLGVTAIFAGVLAGISAPSAGAGAATISSDAASEYGAGSRVAADPAGGYWTTNAAGIVRAHAGAASYGSLAPAQRTASIVGIAAMPDGTGYWLVGSDGNVYPFGHATSHGSTAAVPLNRPIVGMAPTRDGNGYWLVGSDGGVFAFGDAIFGGSTGSTRLSEPVVGLTPTNDSGGYWLVGSDGGVFAFGDAVFDGSTATTHLRRPVVALAPTPDDGGYWLVGSRGRIFAFGDASRARSSTTTGADVLGMVVKLARSSYTLVESNGGAATFRAKPLTGAPSSSGTTTTVPAAAPQAGAMSVPAGYASSQLIFDDQFSGTSLDTSKWTTYLGAQGQRWNNNGNLPAPYSGPNTPVTNESAMFGPSQVSVDNGLTLTATRNATPYASAYPELSGVVTTEGKFTLPTSGWYVQVKAKMPDSSAGMWPAIWFLPPVSGTPFNELDGYEGGWLGTPTNDTMHSDYFADQGQQQNAYDVGTDLTTGYHVYGFQFIPGHSVTAFLDGRRVWQVNASSGISITAEPYEIILELQVATEQTGGYHTVDAGVAPPASMEVAQVQAYSSSSS
jgi:glycosyl hydrolase family 16